jgi:hypothetical protein
MPNTVFFSSGKSCPNAPLLSRVGAKPALDASGCAERGSQDSSRRLNRRYPTWLPVARDPPAGPVGRSELSSSPSSFSSLLILLPPQTSVWQSIANRRRAKNISFKQRDSSCCGVSDSLREKISSSQDSLRCSSLGLAASPLLAMVMK